MHAFDTKPFIFVSAAESLFFFFTSKYESKEERNDANLIEFMVSLYEIDMFGVLL